MIEIAFLAVSWILRIFWNKFHEMKRLKTNKWNDRVKQLIDYICIRWMALISIGWESRYWEWDMPANWQLSDRIGQYWT